jgi:lipid-A-disaccharide synthase
MSGRIFLLAAEASGDALGADLARALTAKDPTLEILGIGGGAMSAAGVTMQGRIDDLSIVGFAEGLMAYARGTVVKRAEEATDKIIVAKPDAVVLIDSWGFTLRVAQRLKARAPQIARIKYIGPQVWATRPGRAKTLAEAVDHLICIHAFEVPFYTPHGLACTVAGNPAFGRFAPGNAAAFRVRHGIDQNAPFVLVLPGSRASEIRRIGPTLWRAAAALKTQRPALRTAIVLARDVAPAARAQAPADALILDETEKDDAFAAATVALAASGTVTTELALQGAAVIVGYKIDWPTWAVARAMLGSKSVVLMNVAAGKEVAPELIQTRFTVPNIVAAATPLLDDPAARERQVKAQNAALQAMGRSNDAPADLAADAVLHVMTERRAKS